MNICSYGCNKEGKYKLKNGKYCCSKSSNSCSSMREKNSIGVKKNRKYKKDNNIKRTINRVKCKYCNIEFANHNISRHEKACYLNPDIIRYCPICDKIIKYKDHTTCSQQCAQIYFRDMFDKVRANRDMSWVIGEPSYINICFKYHDKKCIVCNEDVIVAVHHYDGDKTNNIPTNLVPLCPTHHVYIHSTLENMYIIKECVDEYVEKFKLKYSKVD